MVAGSPQCGLRCGDPDRLGRELVGAWTRTGWGFFYICEATRRRHAAARTLDVDIPPSHRSGGAPPGALLSGAHPNPDNRTHADIRRSGRRRALAAFSATSRTDAPCLRRFHGCFTPPRAQLTVMRHSTSAQRQRSSRPRYEPPHHGSLSARHRTPARRSRHTQSRRDPTSVIACATRDARAPLTKAGARPANQPGAHPSHQPPRGRSPHLMKPSSLTASYSSWRALMLWSIPARVASEISRPSTTCHSPPSEVTGKPKFRPAGTP